MSATTTPCTHEMVMFRREAAMLLRFALEAQSIWPELPERARPYAEQVTRMESQHGLLDDRLAAAR